MKPLTRPDAEEDIRLTLNDYKKLLGHDVPTALPDTVAALLDLLDRYCEARFEEGIQLGHQAEAESRTRFARSSPDVGEVGNE